ncbi:MAG: hypothetical protein IH624_13890 [Phycisphaerae bacterium]|nr:hypothetical protein [Phycisphaerae bacterium]
MNMSQNPITNATTPPPPTVSWPNALQKIEDTTIVSDEAGLDDLRYAGGKRISIGDRTFELAENAWETLAGYRLLPPNLLPQLGRGLGGMVLKCITDCDRRSKNAPDRLRLFSNGKSRILAIAPADMVYLSNAETVQAVKEAMPAGISSENLFVSLTLIPTAFELQCYTEQISVAPRVGDILCGGITIRHSQAGVIPTAVLGYIYWLVCKNGMTQRVCVGGKPARTKRCKANNSKVPMLDAVLTQVSQAWQQLENRLAGIKELAEHRLEYYGLPEALRRRWSINRATADEIAAAMHNDELGRPEHLTEYDLVNALSRVATHNSTLAARYRWHLSMAAGMFAQRRVHQCPTCGSWYNETAN